MVLLFQGAEIVLLLNFLVALVTEADGMIVIPDETITEGTTTEGMIVEMISVIVQEEEEEEEDSVLPEILTTAVLLRASRPTAVGKI